MINKKFRDNWREILHFNSNVELGDKFKKVDNKVRIPLTPIDIEPYLLYHMFEILYPKLINDQQNILDIIISDDGNDVLELFLYETKKAGIHESVDRLPPDFIKFRRKDLDDIDRFYNRIMEGIIKKKGIRVSSIRVFKKRVIENINKYCIDMEELPFDNLLMNILELIQTSIEQGLFIIYPEPNTFKFIRDFISFLDGLRLKKLFKLIFTLLPEFNLAITLESKNLMYILHLQKVFLSKQEKPYLRFKIMSPGELGLDSNNLDESGILEAVREQLRVDNAYFIRQDDILSILLAIFNLPINFKEEHILLLIQKILFGFRSYETHWRMKPKPKVYNTITRFLLKLLGFNLNFRKISHWAIPDFFSSLFRDYIGLNSKLLLIFTDINESKNLAKAAKYVVLLEIENRTLIKIRAINKKDLIKNGEVESFESIRLNLSERCGFISQIIIIDKLLLKNIIKFFIFEHTRYAFLSKIKTLKMFKNQKLFYMFPEIPPYKLIQKKGSVSLLKLILPILIDKHEF
ncbi:MAG: hypothetical protein ACXAEX_15545 [Promethearchaeota archaeon]|jgi:hypothetical protein